MLGTKINDLYNIQYFWAFKSISIEAFSQFETNGCQHFSKTVSQLLPLEIQSFLQAWSTYVTLSASYMVVVSIMRLKSFSIAFIEKESLFSSPTHILSETVLAHSSWKTFSARLESTEIHKKRIDPNVLEYHEWEFLRPSINLLLQGTSN